MSGFAIDVARKSVTNGLTFTSFPVLGSSVALNAILSASVVFIQMSYIVPIALVVFRGRKILDVKGFPERTLTLGRFGYVVNVAGLVFALVTTVFFVFPPL